ncbi:hypothetical protein IFM89_028211 [Coptis chinensis]|uniref:Uncharacterized protein n=1 Tax=Coptis chinensis TaxID=261450 RepID=A0A835LP81_9MAGN|nr:hypothetical protein IFM89_028211 [Coptis chinensis]
MQGRKYPTLRQRADMPQVSGAIFGPHLGEASHRLLRNTLQMKPSTSALLDYPANRYHVPNNHTVDRPRLARPSGYERGYGQDQNYFHGNFSNPRGGTIVNSRSTPSCNEMWKEHNYRAQERVKFFTVIQNFELSDIVKNLVILALSLEKRIIPRCNVLEILYSNGLIGRVNPGLVTSALTLNEEKFIEKYVTKYQVTVPEMLQIGLADFERGGWARCRKLRSRRQGQQLKNLSNCCLTWPIGRGISKVKVTSDHHEEVIKVAISPSLKESDSFQNFLYVIASYPAYWNSNSIHLHTFTFGSTMGGDNYGNLNMAAKLRFNKYDIISEEDFVALGERMTYDYKGGDDQQWRARVLFDFQGPSDNRRFIYESSLVFMLRLPLAFGDRGLIFMMKPYIMLLLCLWFLNPDVCRMNLHVH